jgi:hypothetical protein
VVSFISGQHWYVKQKNKGIWTKALFQGREVLLLCSGFLLHIQSLLTYGVGRFRNEHILHLCYYDRRAVAVRILKGKGEGMPCKKSAPYVYETWTMKNVCNLKENENSYHGKNSVQICPDDGGIMFHWSIGTQPKYYMDNNPEDHLQTLRYSPSCLYHDEVFMWYLFYHILFHRAVHISMYI